MTDREEREEHIKRLEAALACEEKQFSGKCSKQTCDDNCALLYEQGNWGEWKETLRYAINSLKIDLKYDLLYEGVDCNNCKNNLHRGDGSTYCATGDGICHYECEEPTTKNDLGVEFKLKDYVSREAVRRIIKSPRTQEQMLNALNSLRNATEYKAEVRDKE